MVLSEKVLQKGARKNWCITWNNYDDNSIPTLKEIDYQYMIIGKEVGKEGTKHLQCYIQFKTRVRFTAVKKLLPNTHIEGAKGSAADNTTYCKKDEDFIEYGERIDVGKANIVDLINNVVDGKKPSELLEIHGEQYAHHIKKATVIAVLLTAEKRALALKNKLSSLVLRPWQQETLSRLESQNDRQILFVVGHEGNEGKTTLSDYIMTQKNAIVFDNTCQKDCAYMYSSEEYVIFDIPRQQLDKINYGTFEKFKNNILMSNKYESVMKYAGAKVIVFMNETPNTINLSADRVDIQTLNEEKPSPGLSMMIERFRDV